VEKIQAKMKEVIEKSDDEVKVRRTKGTRTKNEWWYKECEQSKKEAVKVLREWRRNKIDRHRFLDVKRRYRERCEEKRKLGREREEKEIKEIRTEKEVWKYINRERKQKESVSKEITMQEWEEGSCNCWKGERKKERQKHK
jgi:hypothetical protein